MTKLNYRSEIEYNDLSTLFEEEDIRKIKEQDNNKFEVYNDFDKNFLKPKDKIDKVVNVILGLEYIFFIHQVLCENKNSKEKIYKNKVVIRDKNFNILNEKKEIELNSNNYYISEIKEDENYIIISEDNKLYIVKDFNRLKLIYDMQIYLILQIKNKEYIISNNDGIFKYKGSILKITRENLKIVDDKIPNLKYDFGVFISEGKFVLAKNNKFLVYNNNKKEKISIYKGLIEKCYASLKVDIPNVLDNNTSKRNILIFGYKKDGKYGFLFEDFQSINGKFKETDKFEVSCIFKISKYRSSIINAFLGEYDINLNYLLVAGYQHDDYNDKKFLLKLYKFNIYNIEMEFIKNIGIENCQPAGLGSITIPDINIDSIICKSIIQYDKKTLLMICIKEIILMDIMNLETDIEEEIIIIGNNLFHIEFSNYYDKKNGYYSCILQDIKNIPNIFEDNLIKNIYQLQNGNYIISQERIFQLLPLKMTPFLLNIVMMIVKAQ